MFPFHISMQSRRWNPNAPVRALSIIILFFHVGIGNKCLADEEASLHDVVDVIVATRNTIKTLRLEVRRDGDVMVRTEVGPNESTMSTRKTATRFSYVSKDEKKYYFRSESVSPGNPIPNKGRTTVYDGQEIRTIVTSTNGEKHGIIWESEKLIYLLEQAPAEGTGILRAWGSWIDGRSLLDWLSDDSAKIVGEVLVNHLDAIVVEVNLKFDWTGRFYLGKDLNYALIKYEYLDGDDLITETTVERFKEVIPGLWFPVVTTMRSHRPPAALNVSDLTSTYKVLDLEINVPILDSLFEVEFEADITIEDRR